MHTKKFFIYANKNQKYVLQALFFQKMMQDGFLYIFFNNFAYKKNVLE